MVSSHISRIGLTVVFCAWVATTTAPAQQWSLLPYSRLTQIAVGDQSVWGINAAHSVYQYNFSTQKFARVPGVALKQIAAGKSEVWGIDASDQVFRFSYSSGSFQQQSHYRPRTAAAGLDDATTLSADSGVEPRPMNCSNCPPPPSITLAHIAVGSDDDVWGIDPSGQIYQFDSSVGAFNQVAGPALAQIAVGGRQVVWGLSSSGQIYQFNSSTGAFQQVPGWLTQISVGAADEVWGVNGFGQIFQYDPGASPPSWKSIQGRLTQIKVGGNHSSGIQVWGLNSNGQIYQFNFNTGKWNSTQGALVQIAVGSSGVFGQPGVWGLSSSSEIFRYEPPSLSVNAQSNQLGYYLSYSGSNFEPGASVNLYLVGLGGGVPQQIGSDSSDSGGSLRAGTYPFWCGNNPNPWDATVQARDQATGAVLAFAPVSFSCGAPQAHVMSRPKVVVIFWGHNYQSYPAVNQSMSQMLNDLVTGPFMNGLAQYGIGTGSVLNTVFIDTDTNPSNAAPAAQNRQQLQDRLVGWIQSGVVSPPPAINESNILYLILPPPADTRNQGGTNLYLGDNPNSNTPTNGVQGYHWSAKINDSSTRHDLILAVAKEREGGPNLTNAQTFVNNTSPVIGHELVEAFNDPFGDREELGDPCQFNPLFQYLGKWQVQQYWSDQASFGVDPLTQPIGGCIRGDQ